jgi:hypothetical protein
MLSTIVLSYSMAEQKYEKEIYISVKMQMKEQHAVLW